MITVYIWNYRGKNEAWGHASMQCRGQYISWWPEPDGRVASGLSQAAVNLLGEGTPQALRSIYAASPIRNRSYADDVRDEGSPPDHAIGLAGLDELAVEAWWRGFGLDGGRLPGPMRPWHTTELNCSTVVARGLEAGGGGRYSSWFHTWNLVWRPDDVRRYAESIRAGLQQAAREQGKASAR